MLYSSEHCFPEYITCWIQMAYLKSASCSSKGKACTRTSDTGIAGNTRNPVCVVLHQDPMKNRNKPLKNQEVRQFIKKDCLPYFASPNYFLHHQLVRVLLYLGIKSSQLQHL